MHFFELNEDVVQSVLAVTEKSCLLNLARTCRIAYHAVIPHLLASVVFPRKTQYQLGFCHYMLSNAEHRIPAMRSFSYPGYSTRTLIDDDPNAPCPLSLLAQVLLQARNIRKLELFNPETLLQHDPRIADAIAQYPHLTSLVISGSKALSHDMILRLRHLRSLSISDESDIFNFIGPLQSTLEVLVIGKLCGWLWPSHMLSDCGGNQFPNVRRLELCGGYEIPTHILTRLFPNLSHLRLHSRCDRLLPSTLALNKVNSECWPRLGFLRGEVLKLQDLALSGRVHHLQIDGRLGFQELDAFLDLVQIVSPVALRFGVIADDTNETFYEQLARRACDLKYLNLLGGFSYEQTKQIIKSLSRLRVEYLEFQFMGGSEANWSLEQEALEMILNSMPSIRYVELKWGYNERKTRRWEVVRNKGLSGCTLRDFTEELGWLIKHRFGRDPTS